MAASDPQMAMEKPSHAAFPGKPQRRSTGYLAVLAGCCLSVMAAYAAAASLSPQDLQIVGHAAGFLEPPPSGGVVAIVYRRGDAASGQDATAIAAELGGQLQAGKSLLPVRIVADDAFTGRGTALAIAAIDAATPAFAATLREAHLLCVTADIAAVKAGFCTMGIITSPRVEILLNHAAAEAAGIDFAVAFRMMIREM